MVTDYSKINKFVNRSKYRHSQLLSAVTSAIVPGPPSSRSRSERPESSDVTTSEAAKWFRTLSGWASVPGAYLPSPGVMPAQLPFPQFSPIAQDFGMGLQGYQGYPGYRVPQIDFRGQDAVQYSRRPAVSHSSSRFVELSDELEPVVQRHRPRRSQTPVPVSASASRSSSRTCFSNKPSGLESEGGQKKLSCGQLGRHQPRKEQQASIQTPGLFQPIV